MEVLKITISDFNSLSVNELKNLIKSEKIIVVSMYFSNELIKILEDGMKRLKKIPPTWMPLDDNCIDYHRINNEYPGSFVRAKTHSFMFHFYNNMNQELLNKTKFLWYKKLSWRGVSPSDADRYLAALPSDGYVPRVVSHLYPSGGGYLSRHSDPVNEKNILQTLVVGSKRGKDFKTGGLRIYPNSSEKSICIDDYIETGDLLMFDQSHDHEVSPVDEGATLDWNSLSGRLSHIFLFTRSDYLKGEVPDVVSKI